MVGRVDRLNVVYVQCGVLAKTISNGLNRCKAQHGWIIKNIVLGLKSKVDNAISKKITFT